MTFDKPAEQLTLWPADSRVSRSPSPDGDAEPRMNATSGPNFTDSFAKFDPDGSWRKTFQGCCQWMLDGSLEAFSETWPRAGMMRNGSAFRHPPLVPRTGEIGCGLWHTPQASDAAQGAIAYPSNQLQIKGNTMRRISKTGKSRGLGLARQVKMWPTPKAADSHGVCPPHHHGSSGQCLKDLVGGALNPQWVEWLMGCPVGWSDLNCSATTKLFRSSHGSGGKLCNSRRK